jgi:exopolyphosphatase/guanosine-5'-triphosphate,3'-diphosphate pyrophosphatase
MDIAVLDLGSTTFHLQHIRVDAAGRFATAFDVKRSLCLGTQVFADGYLDRRSWLESLNAVGELLQASRELRPDRSVIVATSAIRSASNGSALVRELEQRSGIEIQLLSPQDEARLAYLGQSTSAVVGERRVAAVDLGGGSVELAVGEGARCLQTASLPLGALRLPVETRHGFGADQVRAIATLVREQLRPTLHALRQLGPELVVFGSGSARAARKLLARSWPAPGKTGSVRTRALEEALLAHLGYTEQELIALGVDPSRAPSVRVAAIIMLQILELLEVDEAYVSDKGLRDGVALELHQQLTARRHDNRSAAACT